MAKGVLNSLVFFVLLVFAQALAAAHISRLFRKKEKRLGIMIGIVIK